MQILLRNLNGIGLPNDPSSKLKLVDAPKKQDEPKENQNNNILNNNIKFQKINFNFYKEC